ncbi:contactin-associated protein-like 5 [Nematolebias whitei]|uniref:contactin-associated protein-like 5 n=1 Tax=Nematolebias whitei TaxID=451745 RepID=UPI00189C1EDA|nr:contactin-associated protein-like 5 [Nematolebias whitei]
MLFLDYNSVFNTIRPGKQIEKLTDLGVSTPTCNWILDFLTDRPQMVRIGGQVSNKLIISTGSQQVLLKHYKMDFQVFPGNSNANSVVQHKLQHPAIARYVLLIPLDWNPNGQIGLRLEVFGCPYNSDTVSFDGHSSLFFRLNPRMMQATTESISLKFKTMKNSGTLFHTEGPNEHGLTLALEKGKLLLLLRKGRSLSLNTQHVVSLGSLLDDQYWHQVAVEIHRGHLNLTVDKSTTWVEIPPWFGFWDHDQVNVGAGQDLKSQRSNRNFHGCLENLIYHGLNLVALTKQEDQRVTVKGEVTFSCTEPVFVAMTFTGHQSFLRLPGGTGPSVGTSVGLQFRTWDREGLLLTFELSKQEGTVWLHLSEASLHLQIHKPGRMPLELKAGWSLSDGQWHSVDLTSGAEHLSVTVDGNEGTTAKASPSYQVTPGSQLFFGGCPADNSTLECTNPFRAFQGCLRLLTINNQPVDLVKVQQRRMGDYSNLQIDMCGIIDRCSPHHCEHGGSCSQLWSTFHCNCSGTGYSGATCHSSIYEQSCEAYKHKGNTSGHYYIDVDGSGPIKPQMVFCNMTEDKTWMVIQHNNTELTKIHQSPEGSHYSTTFKYAADEEQLLAIISQSEHCEQEVEYHCRKSCLFNTSEGFPLSWWVGGPDTGQKQTYWDGALPGSQQCTCSLEENYTDPKQHCDCDVDSSAWVNDSGLLTHKESLPVRSLVLGDIQRPGSESAYKVGPLRCHGDKNIWNAALFNEETSYLHFPTFHRELSSDFSFLFKTTSSSGVFLENLGIRDFLRIELSSSTDVLFSFDTGNGPLQVRVKAGFPLNDDRWHRIRAERNVKEASLRIDELPAAMQEAPADGPIHLQLNSQLFIGGTASRQKGFRGCIRALQRNGVPLDLEERARITPGVQTGCPGHCSSYGSLCQNSGQCVEEIKSFSCDCSPSAYTGAFCDEEVSVSFKPQTSISYFFTEQKVNEPSIRSFSSTVPDLILRAENISLSFRTNQSPALLLCLASYHGQYLALLLNKQDMLEVRYRLDSSKDAEILRSKVKNLANQQLHDITIHRLADTVTLQIDQNDKEHFNLTSGAEFNGAGSLTLGRKHNFAELDRELAQLGSLGFTGCLSAVLFNSISPLKAALLHPNISPVVVSGPLIRSSCGFTSANPYTAETTRHLSDQSGSERAGQPVVNAIRSESVLIGGIVALAIFGMMFALVILARFLYRRKGTFQNQEVKKTEDTSGLPFTKQTCLQNGMKHSVLPEGRSEQSMFRRDEFKEHAGSCPAPGGINVPGRCVGVGASGEYAAQMYPEVPDRGDHLHHCSIDIEWEGSIASPAEIHYHLLGLLEVDDEVVPVPALQALHLPPV